MDIKDKIREALLELGYEKKSALTYTNGRDHIKIGYEKKSALTYTNGRDHIKIDYDDSFDGDIQILKNFYKTKDEDEIYLVTHTLEEYYSMLLGILRKQKIDKIRTHE